MDVLLTNTENSGFFDWNWSNGDIVTGFGMQDLQTSVITSLFSDASATLDYVLNDGTINRRGCWTDNYTQFPVGSNLWQLFRAAITSQTLLQAQIYAANSLSWLTDTGIAASVNVQCNWISSQALGIAVTITQPITNAIIPLKFAWAWNTNAVSVA